MDITREYLVEQLELLTQQRNQLAANLNANQGIIQHIELLLTRLAAAEESANVSDV